MNKELLESLAKDATTETIFDQKTFALLVIEQCCEVIERNTIPNGAGGYRKVGKAEHIKQHFGVEQHD